MTLVLLDYNPFGFLKAAYSVMSAEPIFSIIIRNTYGEKLEQLLRAAENYTYTWPRMWFSGYGSEDGGNRIN
jgi:hypothetical protein